MPLVETSFLPIIEKYKKFLEKYEVFTYCYRNDFKDFHYVVYKKFGKVTGALVVPNELPRDELLEAAKQFYQFNRVILVGAKQLISDIRRPMSIFEEMRRSFIQLQYISELSLRTIDAEIEKIDNCFKEVALLQGRLKEIFTEMQAIEKEVLDRGFLLKEDTDKMIALNIDHYKTVYHQARISMEPFEEVETVKQYLLEMKPSISNTYIEKVNQSLNYIGAYQDKKNIATFEESISTYEFDRFGNKIEYQAGLQGLQHFEIETGVRIGQLFDSEILPHLRGLPKY